MAKLLTILAPDEFKVVTVPNVVSVGSKLNLGEVGSALTLTANAITITSSYHQVTCTGTAAQRSLRTINGGAEGDVLVLKVAVGSDAMIVDDSVGNIQCAGDFTMNSPSDTIVLLYDGAVWMELCRSNNS
jgi:hypothetical protein